MVKPYIRKAFEIPRIKQMNSSGDSHKIFKVELF